jgi:hypothetical protein
MNAEVGGPPALSRLDQAEEYIELMITELAGSKGVHPHYRQTCHVCGSPNSGFIHQCATVDKSSPLVLDLFINLRDGIEAEIGYLSRESTFSPI